MSEKRINATKTVVGIAMLIAIEIVFSRFTKINIGNNLKFSLSFVAIAVAARKYGVIGGICTAGMGDFIGALLFPVGAYNPLFTLTAVFTGLIFGLCLRKGARWYNIVLGVVLTQVVCSQLIQTAWIAIIYGEKATFLQNYIANFTVRLVQTGLMIPIEIAVLFVVFTAFEKQIMKV